MLGLTCVFIRAPQHTGAPLVLKAVEGEAMRSTGYSPFLCFNVADMDSTIVRYGTPVNQSTALDPDMPKLVTDPNLQPYQFPIRNQAAADGRSARRAHQVPGVRQGAQKRKEEVWHFIGAFDLQIHSTSVSITGCGHPQPRRAHDRAVRAGGRRACRGAAGIRRSVAGPVIIQSVNYINKGKQNCTERIKLGHSFVGAMVFFLFWVSALLIGGFCTARVQNENRQTKDALYTRDKVAPVLCEGINK